MSIYHRYADVLPLGLPENFKKPNLEKHLIQPLEAGQVFPAIQVFYQDILQGRELLQSKQEVYTVTIQKPLVLAFYSAQWSLYGTKRYEQLQDLHNSTKVSGGSFLMVTGEDKDTFEAWHDARIQASFDMFQDRRFELSKQVGLFSSSDPLWGRVSGIDADTFAPAVYVIGTDHKIIYSFVDDNLTRELDNREVIAAVNGARKKAVA